MEFPIEVRLVGPGGLLSLDTFRDIDKARCFIATDMLHTLKTGDVITVNDLRDEIHSLRGTYEETDN